MKFTHFPKKLSKYAIFVAFSNFLYYLCGQILQNRTKNMSLISKIFNKKEENEIGGMQDYMTLIRVYFQAAIAAQVGITNIAMLPDLRIFKSTFHVPTEHNKLGLGEKTRCRKISKPIELNAHTDDADKFFKEIDKSVGKNCRKLQDVQPYLLQFQGFTQDTMMLMGNLMKFKLRIPSFFKGVIRTATEKTVNQVFTSNNFSDPGTLKTVVNVRKYNQRLGFSQNWVNDFVYQIVMLAKKEKQPAEQQ